MSNLQRIRKAAGLSQSALAKLAGVSPRMIQFYEQGIKDINKAQGITLYKIAQILNVHIEDILEVLPYGYKERKGKIVIDKKAAEHINSVVDEFLNSTNTGTHEPIVSEELFKAAQEKRTD